MFLRRIWSRQWFRVQKVASIVNMMQLMLILSLTIWKNLEWRGGSIYVGVPLIMLVIASAVLAFANVWVIKMRMHTTDRSAAVVHDPVQVYAYTPFESTMWLSSNLPNIQAQINAWKSQGVDVEEWQEMHDKIKRWATQGFIPMDEAPEHIRRHYMGTKGEAL